MLKHSEGYMPVVSWRELLLGSLIAMVLVAASGLLFHSLIVAFASSVDALHVAPPLWRIVGLLLILINVACMYWAIQVTRRIKYVLYNRAYWTLSFVAFFLLFILLAIELPVVNYYWLYFTD